MADESSSADRPKGGKRKIDLKSRLSSVRATGPVARTSNPSVPGASDPLAFPPPPTGSVPAPKLPGISAPALSSPFAPPEEKKKSGEAQTIKVEVSEEVIAVRAKTKKRTAVYALIAGGIALVLGFFLGMVRGRGEEQRRAVTGAATLASDIEAANKSMMALSDALRAAVEKLQQDEFPVELAETLKSTNVPFSAENFTGKGVGGLPPEVLNPLLKYTSGVDDLNKKKDSLRNLLTAAQPQVEKYIAEKKKPVVNFSVLVKKAGDSFVAQLVPNKAPFPEKETKEQKWPEEYEILKAGAKTPTPEKVKRLIAPKIDGDFAVPVDEKTVAGMSNLALVLQLRKVLNDTKLLLDGNESPVPSEQTEGLIKDGDALIEGLRKVARAG
jgi:hypothetical protein